MPRKLAMERTYSLAEYQPLKVFDEIDVPDELSEDTEYIDHLRLLQLIGVDLVYQRYVLMRTKLANVLEPKERYAQLLEMRANTMEELANYLKEKK